MHNLASVSSNAISKARPFIYKTKKKKEKKSSLSVHFVSHNLHTASAFCVPYFEEVFWWYHQWHFVHLWFLYGDKNISAQAIFPLSASWAISTKNPLTLGCGAREREKKGQTGYKEWDISRDDQTELFFKGIWVTEHRDVLETQEDKQEKNLIYLWLFDVFIFLFLPTGIIMCVETGFCGGWPHRWP